MNASARGGIRGLVAPLLLDIARKPNFLYDNAALPLDSLLGPPRGATVLHPVYPSDKSHRADVAEFLRGLSVTER